MKKQFKIITIISNQAFSLINFRSSLIRELVQRGVQVFALAPDYTKEHSKQISQLGAVPISYSLSRTGINPIRDSIDTIKLSWLLAKISPDISFGYFIKPAIFGTIAARMAKIPHRVVMIEGLGVIFTPTEHSYSFKYRLIHRLVSFLYAQALRFAHRIVFLNQDDLQEFADLNLVQVEKTHCLGGIGVNLQEWQKSIPIKNPLTFILVARLLREKGIVEYVQAARQVKAQHPEIRFLLLGGIDSNPGSLSQAVVESWVAEGVIEWPGHVPVQPWLQQASVFVLPSYYREGVPRSTQEAMAMGRPVITTDVPGCRETVVHGENGLLIPARDVVALVDAMLFFVRHPKELVRMGTASRRLAEERFDERVSNATLLRILSV